MKPERARAYSRSVRARGLVVALAAALTLVGPATARTAHHGGTLTVAATLEPFSLDPTLSTNPTLLWILPAMCLPLYTYASNHGRLELDPILAAAPPAVSADKLTYTIQLRQGIQFNDGTPFNAQAVISSYQRYTTYPGSVRASDFAGVDAATATGQYTVVYHLRQRNSAFTGNLFPLSPTAIAKEGSGFSADPICVGPFMVDSWTPGVNVTLVKSPYYYKRGAIYLDKLVFKFLANAQVALTALQAGDVQFAASSGLPPTSPNLTAIKAVQPGWGGLVINIGNKNGMGNPPYSNVGSAARAEPEAAAGLRGGDQPKHGHQDRLERVCGPELHADPGRGHRVVPQTKVPCTPYDPKDAKRLVAASGYPLPITVHLLTTADDSLRSLRSSSPRRPRSDSTSSSTPSIGPTYAARANAGNFDVHPVRSEPDRPGPEQLHLHPT